MSSSPSFIASPANPVGQFENADGTAFKTLYTAGASGARIDSLIGTNTDTVAAYVVQLAVTISAVDYVIGEVSIPIGSGTNGSAKSVAMLNSTDVPGLAYTEDGSLYLQSGAILKARVKTAVSGSFKVQILGVGGSYA
jgi:hypothetical protein